MKKVLCLIVLIMSLLYVSTYATDVTVLMDGGKVFFDDAKPQIINGRVMVPMRTIFEKLKAELIWNSEDESITAKKDNVEIYLKIGNSVANVDGKDVTLDSPPEIINDRTFVPLRFVSESLGLKVFWNEEKNQAAAFTKKYFERMNDVTLKKIIEVKFGNVIKTSLGNIAITYGVHNKTNLKDGTLSFEKISDVVLYLNKDSFNKGISNATIKEKKILQEELKDYIKKVAEFSLDCYSKPIIIGGCYHINEKIIANDSDSAGNFLTNYNKRTFSWCNYNLETKNNDGKGFRWATQLDEGDIFN